MNEIQKKYYQLAGVHMRSASDELKRVDNMRTVAMEALAGRTPTDRENEQLNLAAEVLAALARAHTELARLYWEVAK